MALKTSIYLNDDLQRQLDEYLAQHPDESLSSVLQQALEAKLVRVQVNAAAELLKIAGIAQNAPPTDDSNREELL